MSFRAAVRDGFSRYVGFSGRTSRSGYWWWQLFVVAGLFSTVFVDSLLLGDHPRSGVSSSGSAAQGLFLLIVFVPSVTVLVRRLHDSGLSAWWALAFLIPVAGFFIWLIYTTRSSTPGPNRFGPETTGTTVVGAP